MCFVYANVWMVPQQQLLCAFLALAMSQASNTQRPIFHRHLDAGFLAGSSLLLSNIKRKTTARRKTDMNIADVNTPQWRLEINNVNAIACHVVMLRFGIIPKAFPHAEVVSFPRTACTYHTLASDWRVTLTTSSLLLVQQCSNSVQCNECFRQVTSNRAQPIRMDEKMFPFDAFIRREGQTFMNDATSVEQFSLLKTDQERIVYILPKIQAACLAGLQDWDGAEGCLRAALAVLRDDSMPKEQKAAFAMQLASQMKTLRLRRLDVGIRARERVPLPPTPALISTLHASIPNACDAIEMRFTPEKGRHLVANRTIEPGSVLIVDRPYAWMTVPSSWHDHCANCCRPVLSSVPCRSCSAVCFCDAACRDASWSEFHRWECGILEHFVYSKELSTMALLVLRVITRAGLITLSEAHFSDDAYSNVFLQQTNDSQRPVTDMLKRTLTAVFLEKCLETTGFCSSIQGTLVASMLLRHLQSCSCNAYEITENLDIGDRNEDVTIGGAVYSSISLANHSCNNNVVRNSYGRNCVVRALRFIKEGEEISDNYGYSFLSCKQQERSVELKRQYFFICDCEACSNHWPLFSQLTNKSDFKCPRCLSILNRPPCTTCYSKKDAKSIERQFSEIPATYQKAVQKLAAKDIENCILLSQKSIKFLCAWVIQPNKELIKWQQVLLRCWSLCGSTNNIIFPSGDENE
ncbi:hypothetical protein B566_EDAN000998 [Ephemera danica]|nr:hypothetical protein B566_EDAN000998 [Ephemera danica]